MSASTQAPSPTFFSKELNTVWQQATTSKAQVDWLMAAFKLCFSDKNTLLVPSELVTNHAEPEYLPATKTQPAMICFAHGYFASCLHELAHWCIAGTHRRTLPDFGYWYAPDGRSEAQQKAFEKVEVKPQAIEWLFTLACNKRFFISQDNLSGDQDANLGSVVTFKQNVCEQAQAYLRHKDNLPPDALRWFTFLQTHIRPNNPVQLSELCTSSL